MVVKHLLNIVILLLISRAFAQYKESPAIDFTLEDTQGNFVNLFEEMENDKTVMLFFFSSNCGGCHVEAPKVDSIYRQFGSGQQQLLVWGIAEENSTLEDVIEFIEETEITFPCFPTGHATDVFELYDVGYTPQIFIICDYNVSESISFFEMIENLDYCFPTELIHEQLLKPQISINNNRILINSDLNVSEIKIYDISGKVVWDEKSVNSNSVESNSLISGNLYLITFIFENGYHYSEKVIIR
ncbi:MAG TPA: redoxin domain-containing protein [Bacteroidales bacterium]|nr:redoxin domain-containing protein [Bacteroidales bacterium]